jgi:hypothetical protein
MSHGWQNRRLRGPGALPAILAVLALLMQTLVPAVAMAHAPGDSRIVVLCTPDGEKIVTINDEAPQTPFAGYKCHDCVIAAVTTVSPPSPVSLPVRYAAIVRHERAQASVRIAPAQPPPRPPGQGPPLSI